MKITEKKSLAGLNEGESAVVAALGAGGAIRARLQEIGFIPGAEVKCVRKSPLGDPVAYGVRGAIIALRSEDAETIFVEAEGPGRHV